MEDEMSKGKDLREHFEAIVGRDLPPEISDGFTLREAVSVYGKELGARVSRHIVISGTPLKSCGDLDALLEDYGNVLDVSGVGATGADGTVEFLLSDYHCFEDFYVEHPVNLLATPRAHTPVFLTMDHALTEDRHDVKITVMAWNASGSPVANVAFDWRCRVSVAWTLF
jgi:hypothetical protein